jgi:hypothetical protein
MSFKVKDCLRIKKSNKALIIKKPGALMAPGILSTVVLV